MVGGLTCNACNSEFADEAQQKLHYKSEWHRYNLKRKVLRLSAFSFLGLGFMVLSRFGIGVAGVPGVTEALFQARQSALAAEQRKLNETPMLYECALCGKAYRSSKAHAQHLKSRAHTVRASQEPGLHSTGITVVKPLANRGTNKSTSTSKPPIPRVLEGEESEDSGDEWEEVESDDDLIGGADESLMNVNVKEPTSSSGVIPEDDEDDEELDPSCCLICDLKHKNIESCMVHMHKRHGFFIPDVEYLKDPEGLLTYVGLKVKRDFLCLYCNDRCQPFQSFEAVRKHMIAKGHCKVRYGDGGDDEEAELEEFYDYSSSYVDSDGKQLVALDDMCNAVELGSGGSELVITKKTDSGISVKALGSREFLRYYRQKPRPSHERNIALAISLASRYRNMGLATVQSKDIVRMKILKEMNKSGVEAMRTKIGMKNNAFTSVSVRMGSGEEEGSQKSFWEGSTRTLVEQTLGSFPAISGTFPTKSGLRVAREPIVSVGKHGSVSVEGKSTPTPSNNSVTFNAGEFSSMQLSSSSSSGTPWAGGTGSDILFNNFDDLTAIDSFTGRPVSRDLQEVVQQSVVASLDSDVPTRPPMKSILFTEILSNNANENPDFYNSNRVKIRYCTFTSKGCTIAIANPNFVPAVEIIETEVKCFSDAGFFVDAATSRFAHCQIDKPNMLHEDTAPLVGNSCGYPFVGGG
ncbi:hypothetical protein ACLOJK_030677 [Asimina triloba]